MAIIVGLHLAGVLLFGLRATISYLKLRRLMRLGAVASEDVQSLVQAIADDLSIRCRPPVLVSSHCDAPFATGVFRPRIVIPASSLNLPMHQLEVILAHELVHLNRRDPLVGWCEVVVGCVWWFHPVMWLLRVRLRQVREDCCDDVLMAPSRAC